MAKQSTASNLSEIIFRERINGGNTELVFSDVGFTSDYLIMKLDSAPEGFSYEDFLSNGVNLMHRVQEAFVDGGCTLELKTEIANYLSNAMANFLRINQLNEESKKSYAAQLAPQNRDAFNYDVQVVDALIELAIQTGTIQRDATSPWKNLKMTYRYNKSNEVIEDAYKDLFFMKVEIDNRYPPPILPEVVTTSVGTRLTPPCIMN